MSPSAVCFGAKDNSYGSFKIPVSGSIITFKLTYVSGSVSCHENTLDAKSKWGCKFPGLSHTMATHITDSNRKRLLPTDKYLSEGPGCGYYNLPWATPVSPELLFDNFSVPLPVATNQKFQVWFGEDLFDHNNCWESDNGYEKTCAEVYGLYV